MKTSSLPLSPSFSPSPIHLPPPLPSPPLLSTFPLLLSLSPPPFLLPPSFPPSLPSSLPPSPHHPSLSLTPTPPSPPSLKAPYGKNQHRKTERISYSNRRFVVSLEVEGGHCKKGEREEGEPNRTAHLVMDTDPMLHT